MTSNSPGTHSQHRLNEIVRCEQCSLPMTATHDPLPRYICPNRLRGGPDDCPTPPVSARHLDEQVVWKLVSHLAHGPGLQRVASEAGKEANRVKAVQREKAGKAEERLKRQNRERLDLLEKVEAEETTYSQATGQVEELNDLRSKLQSQVRECADEALRQDFISDERRLRDAAGNIQTYLDTTEPETARELYESFIKEVLVRPGSATIRYTVPMPPLVPRSSHTQDEIKLD